MDWKPTKISLGNRAQSIEAALDEIERIYNFKKPQGLKVSIKYEYLVDKTNR